MLFFRSMIGRVALILVCCQAASLSLATAALWPGPLPVRIDCTCTHGDHAVCPMHHGRRPDERRCAIGNAAHVPSATLTTALDIGMIGVALRGSAEAAGVPVTLPASSTVARRPQPPDPPPPRA